MAETKKLKKEEKKDQAEKSEKSTKSAAAAKKTETKDTKQSKESSTKKSESAAKSNRKDSKKSGKSDGRRGRGRGRGRSRNRRRKDDDEFDSRVVDIRRVSHSYKGGRRLRISVCVVVGDREGKVGVGTGSGSDVRDAQRKAISDAKSNMITVPLKGNTIPHELNFKHGAAKLFLRPAAPGTGIIAGGPVRLVVELAGVKDVLSKVLGTRNPINNAYAAVEALKSLRLNRL